MAAPRCDRREILRLIGPYFPTLAPDITSEELHGFLDLKTGIETPLNEPNATAFDRWRQILAKKGFPVYDPETKTWAQKTIPVWGITPEKAAAIKARAEELQLEETTRITKLPELLATLKKDAPLVTAAELLNPPKVKP